MLTYHQMREEEKEQICNWKYPGEYGIYDLPSYKEMQEKKFAFGNPREAKNFYSYFDGEQLIGFINLVEEANEVFIGIGVEPAKCGNGYGQKMLKSASEISRQLYPGKQLYLEVRTWNKRAVHCYEKAGFVIDGGCREQKTYAGDGTFYRMIQTMDDAVQKSNVLTVEK